MDSLELPKSADPPTRPSVARSLKAGLWNPGLVLASALGLLALACSPGVPSDFSKSSDGTVAASFDGGQILMSEVERSLLAEQSAPGATRLQGREQWLSSLTRVAEQLAFEKILVPEEELASLPELADITVEVRRDSTIDSYLEFKRSTALPTEIEIATFYEQNPDLFEQVGRRFVWHIFRRQRPDENKQAPVQFLEGLRQRMIGGESFRSLAARYSDSETRLLEGRLGWVVHDRLPANIEQQIFALKPGELSEIIPVAGGAALFQVTDAFYAKSFSLEDARFAIAHRLDQVARAKSLESLASVIELPAESKVLAGSDLETTLKNSKPGDVVLRIADFSYTVAQWLKDTQEDAQIELPLVAAQERYFEIYRQKKNRQLAFLRATEEGFPSQKTMKINLEAQIEQQLRKRLIVTRAEEQIQEHLDSNVEKLADFHRSNAHLFQSPLRLEIRTLEVDLSATNASSLMQSFEDLRGQLQRGDITFEQAANKIDGRLSPLQWLGPEALQAMAPKARIYILDLAGTGFSVPFQLERLLIMIWVKSREEPRILSFEEAQARVREEYLSRHGQQLYQNLLRSSLEKKSFKLDHKVLDQFFIAPEATGAEEVKHP